MRLRTAVELPLGKGKVALARDQFVPRIQAEVRCEQAVNVYRSRLLVPIAPVIQEFRNRPRRFGTSATVGGGSGAGFRFVSLQRARFVSGGVSVRMRRINRPSWQPRSHDTIGCLNPHEAETRLNSPGP